MYTPQPFSMQSLMGLFKLTSRRVKTKLGDYTLKQLTHMYMFCSAGCALKAITSGREVKEGG